MITSLTNKDSRIKKIKILLLISLLLLIIIVLFNEITNSSILFFLNKKEVEIFKSKFPDTYLAGNFFINKIGSEIEVSEDINHFLQIELELSYFPKNTILYVRLIEKISQPEFSVRNKREFRGQLKEKVLQSRIDRTIFQKYQDRIYPNKNKILLIAMF